jgi:hypothetical protein
MDEKELTQYIKTLQALDHWKMAYEKLFITNEEHIKRIAYLEAQLAPQCPCHFEGDEPDEYAENNPNVWDDLSYCIDA